MATCNWWEGPIGLRVELNCVSLEGSLHCVMTLGTSLMPEWPVDSSATPLQVSQYIHIDYIRSKKEI